MKDFLAQSGLALDLKLCLHFNIHDACGAEEILTALHMPGGQLEFSKYAEQGCRWSHSEASEPDLHQWSSVRSLQGGNLNQKHVQAKWTACDQFFSSTRACTTESSCCARRGIDPTFSMRQLSRRSSSSVVPKAKRMHSL